MKNSNIQINLIIPIRDSFKKLLVQVFFFRFLRTFHASALSVLSTKPTVFFSSSHFGARIFVVAEGLGAYDKCRRLKMFVNKITYIIVLLILLITIKDLPILSTKGVTIKTLLAAIHFFRHSFSLSRLVRVGLMLSQMHFI